MGRARGRLYFLWDDEMELLIKDKLIQSISPCVIQYMQMLQMTTAELAEYLQRLAEENPVLDVAGPSEAFKRLDWIDSLSPAPAAQRHGEAEYDNAIERSGRCVEESLFDHLRQQLLDVKAPGELVNAAIYLAGSCDAFGYVEQESLDELASLLGGEFAGRCLELLQSLEPAGVGARSLAECITLQLKRMAEDTGLAQRIVRDHLEDLAGAYYLKISRALNSSPEEVYRACEQIRRVSPRPGSMFQKEDVPLYIYPDVIVDQNCGVELNRSFAPSIHINAYYKSLALSTTDAEVKEYLDGKLRQAEWIVKSIEQRSSTLVSCVKEIVARQRDFFQNGGSLSPLLRSEIAEAVGLHVSTVSRALAGKYLFCQRGSFPMDYFFSNPIPSASGEEGRTSSRAVKELISEILSAKPGGKPLSDQKIADALLSRGIRISRRTVAKYRAELGIPNTAARRAAMSLGEDAARKGSA